MNGLRSSSLLLESHPQVTKQSEHWICKPRIRSLSGELTLVLRQRLERRNFEKQLEELIPMCLNSGIGEILLYPHGVGTWDSDTGFWTKPELEHDLSLLKIAKDRLGEKGLSMGLNIWQTIGHSDRGRKMKGEFTFQSLVSDLGDSADSQACPLCESWRRYYFHCLNRYASLQPSSLYFDDDFRFQNHGNNSGSGAFYCFCPLHLADFNSRYHTSYNRTSLIRDIVRPGEPHPVRRQWLDRLNEQLIELAGTCEQIIHEISPKTKIGLMSSSADQMRLEGRNWERLLRAIAGKDRPLLYRPCYPDYLEFPPREHPHVLSIYRQIFRELPSDVIPFAEIDNCMPSEYNQSPAHLSLRMLLAALCGTRGFHLSLFDWNGNGDTFSGSAEYSAILPRFRENLAPILDHLEGNPVAYGVGIPQNVKNVLFKETDEGRSLMELKVDSLKWATPLQLAGLPITFDGSWISALTDDFLWGLDRNDIRSLLSKDVLLDCTAIRWLTLRGYGDWIGVETMEELPANKFSVSSEEVVDKNDPFFGTRFEHKPLAAVSPECRFALSKDAIAVTRLLGRGQISYGPGSFRFQNSLGGMIFGIPLYPQSLLFNPFQTRYRLAGLHHQILKRARLTGTPFFLVKGQPNVLPLHLRYSDTHVLACVNLRSQTAKNLTFWCHAIPLDFDGYIWFENECSRLEWEVEAEEQEGFRTVRIISAIPPNAVCILITR